MRARKRVTAAVLTVLLIGAAGVRIYAVNKHADVPETKVFQKGDVVPFEKDFNLMEEENIDGYTIQVRDFEILPVDEFYSEYDLSAEEMGEDTFTEYYCLVKANFENVNHPAGTETGVNLTYLSLVGTNYYMVIDTNAFSLINPKMPGAGFSLQPGKSIEAILPYAVVPSSHTDYEGLRKDPPKLQITEYPSRKLIEVQG